MADAGLEAKLERAAACGLHKLTVYRSDTGAWHAVALGKPGVGASALRTPDAAAAWALDDFLSRLPTDTAPEEDPFA